MTSFLEQEIRELREITKRHEFQIKVLQKLAANYNMFGVFDLVLSYNLTEEDFGELREITNVYEQKLEATPDDVTLANFQAAFIRILAHHRLLENKSEDETKRFISIWLKGPEGGFGFSKMLYHHFYKSE